MVKSFVSRPVVRRIFLILCVLLVAGLCITLQLLSISDNGHSFPVYISEIVAANTAYPNPEGICCDYIELYNSADHPVDLTGFQLGDIDGSGRYAFPAGTVLEPGAYLCVYCSKDVTGPGYAGFGISRSGGETFYLIGTNRAAVDQATTLPMDTDQAMVRLDGQSWTLSAVPTPGRANEDTPGDFRNLCNRAVSPVQLTELSCAEGLYHRDTGLLCDWAELYNPTMEPLPIGGFVLTDNVGNDKFRFPEDAVLEPGEYRTVYCSDRGPGMAPFGLSRAGGEQVILKNDRGQIVQIVTTLPMQSGSMVMEPDGQWHTVPDATPGFPNTARGREQFLDAAGIRPGSIRITEAMPGAQLVLPDSAGQFPDWVELHNPGSRPVALGGWFLSDDPELPRKWQFPDTVLEPGAFLTIFCDGWDGLRDGALHCSFSLSSGGETLTLSAWDGQAVDTVTFGEAEPYASVCFPEAVWTDCPTPGFANTDTDGFRDTQRPRGPLAIWEVMTANDRYLPQGLGDCYDWAELKNISDSPVNLADFCLTDDPDDPDRFRLPDRTLGPGKSLVVLLSGDDDPPALHGNFSLNAVSDDLLLYTVQGALTDYVHLTGIPPRMSYGRLPDAGGFFYMEPTPDKPNQPGAAAISAMPAGSWESGIYTLDAPCELTLTGPGTIYYTRNGAEPKTWSSVYSGPISITETTVLRAAALEEGKLMSPIYTVTFVVNEPHSLPVVSLTTDPRYLWGPGGVYKNGDPSVKEIRFPGHIAYTGPDGSFSMNCGLNLHGATTVTAFPKKTFAVRFEDQYDGPLHYDLFQDGQVTEFRSILVRTAYESTYSTQIHDALIGQVAAENCPTLPSQKYRYAVLYLNGEYWGMYALRERHSADHYAAYLHVPADSVRICRYPGDGEPGLDQLFAFCKNHSLRDPEDYARAKTVIDPESFADWMIMEAYVSNADVNGNMRYYYSPADGLWRCGLVDLDLGIVGSYKTFDMVTTTWQHGIICNALMQNEEFRDLIARRLAQLLEGPLSDEAMTRRVDSMAAELRPEAPLEEKRWGTPVQGWEVFVNLNRKFCAGRTRQMIDGFCATAGFTQEQKQSYFGHLLP